MSFSTVQFSYHPDGLPVKELFVVGSWDDDGAFDATWPTAGHKMEPTADGRFVVEVQLQAKPGQSFWWGVKDKEHHWMLFETSAIEFCPTRFKRQEYLLGYRHKLGIHRQGRSGFSAAVWAPHAQAVELFVVDKTELSFAMRCGSKFWELERKSGWSDIKGRPYGFRILTSCGQTVVRADPYARVRQGPQRGVADLFLTGRGEYAHRYSVPQDGHHLLRFEAVCPESFVPTLRLFKDGRQLNQRDLTSLCGGPPKLPLGETWWRQVIKDNGDIPMPGHPGVSAYSVCLGPEKSLRGLTYQITDDRGAFYHDRWSTLLDGHHNWARLGIVTGAPSAKSARPQPVDRDLVMYQLHVGSLLGEAGNLKTSTFRDVEKRLSTIKRIGFNAVALMPTNATEGTREWGYLGTCSLAHQESYAAPGQDAQESLLALIDKAHDLKMRVFTDVVYNHVGGFHNDLWEFDGLENSWFERSSEVQITGGVLPARPFENTDNKPRTKDSTVRDTPWGPIPAYTKPEVSQFFVDHALDQVARLGFDGIRFDFTHLIHAQTAGGTQGWEMLRAIHRRLSYFYPETITFAEEFPPHSIMTQPVDDGGAGFTGMWNTEHQHRLIFDHHRPSVAQNLAEGSEPPLDYFTQHLLLPAGFSDPLRSATVLSNHDEVGNAQRLYLSLIHISEPTRPY